MAIPEYEFYHGAALLNILQGAGNATRFEIHKEIVHGCYVVNDAIAVLIKHSSKRMSPWTFTFAEEHLEALQSMEAAFQKSFVLLTCWDDGIIVLEAAQATALLGKVGPAWIRADRSRREMYEINGSLGGLGKRVADRDFGALFGAAR